MSDEPDEVDASRAPLLDHLIELRRRLLYSMSALLVAFGCSLYFARDILKVLVRPLRTAGQFILVNTDVYGGFMVEVKVAFFTAVMISFPITANQVWRFVAPGLYGKEKRALLPFLLPVFLMLLERAGIVTRRQLIGFRRYAIVANFAAAAVLTPPDPWSMMLLALPLVVLYELALIGIWFTERRRAREAQAAA